MKQVPVEHVIVLSKRIIKTPKSLLVAGKLTLRVEGGTVSPRKPLTVDTLLYYPQLGTFLVFEDGEQRAFPEIYEYFETDDLRKIAEEGNRLLKRYEGRDILEFDDANWKFEPMEVSKEAEFIVSGNVIKEVERDKGLEDIEPDALTELAFHSADPPVNWLKGFLAPFAVPVILLPLVKSLMEIRSE